MGLSLGTYWRRGGKSYGFVLSLLIVFLYYFFLNFGETLAKRGIVFAFMGMWLPNVVLGLLGIYLFKRVAREQPLPFLEAGTHLFLPVIEKIKSLKVKIKN